MNDDNVRDGRIDRIDGAGNIREHRVRVDDARRTVCGLEVHDSQAPCGNRKCQRCEQLAAREQGGR